MKPLVGIFAHPDDEVFGPGGTLSLLAQKQDVYLICVTDGDAGENSLDSSNRKLSEIRREELQASAKVLGVKKVFFLGYKDGSLSNNLYHEIAEKIKKILEELRPETIITMEPRGVSGHLDHIAVSLITTFAFEKLSFTKELWYYALTEERRTSYHDYFIYFPPGYKKSEISKTIDTTLVLDQKVEAMHKHASQKHDIDRLLGIFLKQPKEENFIIVKKR